jgi:hypothetical protein
LQALVVDQAQVIERETGLEAVERVIDYIPPEAQRIISAMPVTDGVHGPGRSSLQAGAHDARSGASEPPRRGRVRFRITTEPKEAGALALAEELLSADARHVLFYSRSEDRAADLGDYLTLHGFVAGAPGDTSVPVWLGVEALAARAAAQGVEGVVVVSHDVPADADTLDRRHSIGSEGVVLVLPRELAHLKSLGRRTGYETVPFPPPARRAPTALDQLRAELTRELEAGDAVAYLPVLEPLFERFDPAEVAAAAVSLLRSRKAAAPPPEPRPVAGATPAAAPAWAKLFVSVGERDGLRPGICWARSPARPAWTGVPSARSRSARATRSSRSTTMSPARSSRHSTARPSRVAPSARTSIGHAAAARDPLAPAESDPESIRGRAALSAARPLSHGLGVRGATSGGGVIPCLPSDLVFRELRATD